MKSRTARTAALMVTAPGAHRTTLQAKRFRRWHVTKMPYIAALTKNLAFKQYPITLLVEHYYSK